MKDIDQDTIFAEMATDAMEELGIPEDESEMLLEDYQSL